MLPGNPQPGVTVADWLRTHPHETLQAGASTLEVQAPGKEPSCAVVTGHLEMDHKPVTRLAFFRVPDTTHLHLPADNGPHPELVSQCALSEVTIKSDSGNPLPAQMLEKEQLVNTPPGDAQAFGAELSHRAKVARDLASSTGLPPDEVLTMRTFLEKAAKALRQSAGISASSPAIANFSANEIANFLANKIANFLAKWIHSSLSLPPDRQAAALYSADTLLDFLPALNAPLRTLLGKAGAEFEFNELGSTYSYKRNWLLKAFHLAPNSPAGEQAFLVLLGFGFSPGCCVSGDNFENVIAQAPAYLNEHPHSKFKCEILLALGDAYRDRIAVADGANGDPFNEASRYAAAIKQNYHAALQYYRAAIAESPASGSATQALARAWALEADIPPTDTHFVRLYD